MNSLLFYLPITIIGTVAGQLILKSGMSQVGKLPSSVRDYMPFFYRALPNYRVIPGFLEAFVAGMRWMAAVSKPKLTYAYPFMASTFLTVQISAAYCLVKQFQ